MIKKIARRYNSSTQSSPAKIVHLPPKLSIFSVFSDKIGDGVYKINLGSIEAIELGRKKEKSMLRDLERYL